MDYQTLLVIGRFITAIVFVISVGNAYLVFSLFKKNKRIALYVLLLLAINLVVGNSFLVEGDIYLITLSAAVFLSLFLNAWVISRELKPFERLLTLSLPTLNLIIFCINIRLNDEMGLTYYGAYIT
ncbi:MULTISPECIES: hypothetical protein [Gammaproteobacteria]|uniref:hypothetical protein n=1 Tax=Gammaproteobacteria TaxID=1236 RepID=UPI000DD08285|nr:MULTISPECIES: hypothetical protein [Gammaproteobacteria]RTE85886.1 hypothetical protein DQX04_10590 [Aliidiomarina sp. B3213]TCZ90113.1 hypothetical protein EYQ95_09870 [Lysobacter sp. N42]